MSTKWPRLRGYKIYKRGSTKSDAGKVEWRLYIRTGLDRYEERKLFRGICPEHDLNVGGDTPEEVVDEMETLIRDAVQIEWVPYLHVTVTPTGSLEPPPKGRKVESFFEGRKAWRDHEHDMGFSITVWEVQLAEHDGKKMHREPSAGYGTGKWDIKEDWPEVGFPKERRTYYGGDKHEMRALVKDTPEIRQAIETMRTNMQEMVRKLENVLSPDHIGKTLQLVLEGQAPLALPADTSDTEKKPKRKPRKARRK